VNGITLWALSVRENNDLSPVHHSILTFESEAQKRSEPQIAHDLRLGSRTP
jgi:hypothetical protein